MPSKNTFRLLLAIFAIAGIFTTLFVARSAASKSVPVHQQQIERFLRRHEAIELDSRAAARRVRENGQLSITTAGWNFDLELTPNDLRAPNYRAEEVVDGGGVRSVALNSVQTYRGSVRGLDGAEARFTIDDEKVEGVIITPYEHYYVEPLQNYTSQSTRTDYVFYKASDVIEGASGACATALPISLDAKLKAGIQQLAPRADVSLLTTSNRQVDLATEADYEYVTFFGSSAAANV